jgi:type IV pilus assembly protein PilC
VATFTYDVLDSQGRSIKGKVEAENEQIALSKLHDQKFHVVGLSEAKGGLKAQAAKSQKVKLQSLVIFSRQFATMIDAGIAIIKCLDILESQTKELSLKAIIADVRKDVKGGLSLTDALSKHPHVFSRLYINMIKAAEIGGILDIILDRLSGFLEKEMEIKGKIKSAMMYPTIVLVFAVFIVIALFLFVLPRFKDIFSSMDVQMPMCTQMLFNISDWLGPHYGWVFLLVLGIGSTVAFKIYNKTEKGRYQVDKLKLRVPIFGDLALKMSVSRFARTFGTLIAAGVPMMRSLEIVGETSGNSVLAEAISNARNSIREGAKISMPLANSGLFPAMVTHMVDVGEETGRLSEMLTKVAEFYDDEVDAMVKGLTSLIEPLLIVFMGVLVGFIAISIMSPIFKLVSSIH